MIEEETVNFKIIPCIDGAEFVYAVMYSETFDEHNYIGIESVPIIAWKVAYNDDFDLGYDIAVPITVETIAELNGIIYFPHKDIGIIPEEKTITGKNQIDQYLRTELLKTINIQKSV